jgi:hypothetical protein
MSTNIKVGDTVRIKDSYPEFIHGAVGANKAGTEFEVTKVTLTEVNDPEWQETFYVEGDPNGWAIWGSQVEKVKK